jgi:hypothetical protein
MTVTMMPPAPADFPCPPWCDGQCGGWDSEPLHSTPAVKVPVRGVDGEGNPAVVEVQVFRTDTATTAGEPAIELCTLPADNCTMTPAQARQVAAALLNAVDLAAGGQPAEVPTLAQHLRIGDELLTGDGWQKVIGLMVFANSDYVAVFTPERDGDTDGWPYTLADTVTARLSGVNR